MTVTRHGVCPRCGLIVSTKVLTMTEGTVESISYRTDNSCKCTRESRSELKQEKR